MSIEFSDEELRVIHNGVLSRLYNLGYVEDPRIEELLALDEKLSKAMGVIPRGEEIYDSAFNASLECDLYNMQIVDIVWHKYPEEKPNKDGSYLVTSSNGSVYTNHYWIRSAVFSTRNRNSTTVAWAELPKPFKEEA